MMNLEEKRRQKEGKYSKQEILKMFSDYLDGQTDGCTVEEFVIVCKSKIHGEDGTDVFSSSSDVSELIGMLEVGKLHIFEGRFGD